MIKFGNDQTTLQYTNAAGVPSTVSPLDWELYAQISANQSAQIGCEGENTRAQSNYYGALHNYEANVDAGRGAGLTPPAKPQMKLVSDMGVVTFVPFNPPLPDPKPPVVTLPDNHSAIPNTGLAAGTATTGDPQFQALIKILLTFGANLTALSAKVDALIAAKQ